MKIGTQSSVHCFEELIIFYIPGWLSNQLASKRYSCFMYNIECVVSSISPRVTYFTCFRYEVGVGNECYRVWNLFPGCLCDSKPRYLGSLSNRFSAMYDNRLNPFGDDEDALSDTPRTPSSAGSFRTRAKYFSTLCFPPPLLTITLFAVWSCRFA